MTNCGLWKTKNKQRKSVVISNIRIPFTTPEHFSPYNENHSGMEDVENIMALFKVLFQLKDLFWKWAYIENIKFKRLYFDFQITDFYFFTKTFWKKVCVLCTKKMCLILFLFVCLFSIFLSSSLECQQLNSHWQFNSFFILTLFH